jgi:hypothetical protein
MLTSQQVRKIVGDGIREVTGVAAKIKAGQALRTFGIDTGAKLKRFKSTIVKMVGQRDHKITLSKLDFDQDVIVARVYELIAAQASPLTKPVSPAVGKHPAAKRKVKAAKKAGAKKKAAKKKPRTRGPLSTSWGWGTSGHLGGKKKGGGPSKRTRKRSARRKARGAPVSRDRTHHGGGDGKKSGLKDDLVESTPAETEAIEEETAEYEAEYEEEQAGAGTGGGSLGYGGGGGGSPPAPPHFPNAPAEVIWPPASAGAKAEPPEEPGTRTIECTPQLELRKELVPSQAYRMAVFVDQGPAAPGADVVQVSIEVAEDVVEFPLDVWLDCSSHFSVEELTDPPRIKVKTESGVSDELGFTLKVHKGPDSRPMYVSAFFRYNGRPCGKITRYLEMAKGSLRWKKFVPPGKAEGEVVLPNADAPPSCVVETQAHPADIRVEVLKTEANDGQHFTLKCYTPQSEWEGPWNLPQVTKDLVNTHMQKFMASKEDARIASLEGAGLAFWDGLPPGPKDLLWEALEKGAATMSVISQEPYIPWELMVPYQKVQHPRKPLGVELQLGRWITGDYKSARQLIPMKNGYIVCPKASGLTSAAAEVTFLTQQLKPDFAPVDQVVPASFTGVNKGLGASPRNVIHFICHGKSAALQTLELDKPDTLDCSQVRTLKGFQAAFRDGPLAFLNACEVGGQVLALDGVGGFANSFIELGASAVVAPLWPVQDKAALDVTQTFYPRALKGVPFAAVMKEIRAKAYDQAIDSYAAYCFYGDPMAHAESAE